MTGAAGDAEARSPDAATPLTPPDGGVRAWMVLAASFLCNGLLFGIINTYGVIYVYLLKDLEDAKVSDAASKASLVGSLCIGTTFLVSPIAGVLTDRWGIRLTTAIGGVLATAGMLLSSFVTDNVYALYATYGVLFGVGASLTYTPSLVVLGHYFKRFLGVANGLVAAGSSVFSVLLPYPLEWLLQRFGFSGSLLLLAAMMSLIIGCAMLFKPLMPPPRSTSSQTDLLNLNIWKRRKYVIWALAIPTALFGYFVPYVHMVKYVSTRFEGEDGKILILFIGLASGVGRLVFGRIADIPRVDRILLQQISFFCIGVATMLLTVTDSFTVMKVLALVMGLFDGCFISLLGPIAFQLCGQRGATQAIGCLLGLCSVPLTVGPFIAGLLFDHLGSYRLPFLLAGVPPVVCSVIMFAVRCVPDDPVKEDAAEDDLMVKSAPLEPLADKFGNGAAFKSNGNAHGGHQGGHANGGPATPAPGDDSPVTDKLLSDHSS
ncbi:monocarboxylate transporter 10 isoform X2 [Thrips palmi]|uniref:Monocarboxylate transporter 10 isoform X2 n=1 Tax=Thrips palmi TaxID=161013 RepID=A0A6P9A4P6_THRPL|nr:monocarboxylate transporter 10 isoform X2 [Thrips palmi]